MPDTAIAPPTAPAPPADTPRMLLRVSEVAVRLSLGETMIREMINRGELPAVRIGKAVRVPVDALRQWVAELQTSPEDGVGGRVATGVATPSRTGRRR